MNARLEKILNLPAYQRFLLLLVVMALFAAVFYFMFYQQQIEQYDRLLQKQQAEQVKLDKNRKIARNLSVYRAEYEKMQVKLDEALGELPLEKEIPNLLTGIGNLAKEKGLEVVRFKPENEVPKDFYAEVPVDLKLAGSFHQAAAFFDAVSKMERIVNIQGLSLDRPKELDGRTSLAIDCKAVTFRFIEQAPPAKKGKKKGGKRK